MEQVAQIDAASVRRIAPTACGIELGERWQTRH
jgi:hypothetical protein